MLDAHEASRMTWTQSRAVEKQIAVLGRQSGAGSTFPVLCFTCQFEETKGKEASYEVVTVEEEVSSSLHVYCACTCRCLLPRYVCTLDRKAGSRMMTRK
jgi:hypothetical protein